MDKVYDALVIGAGIAGMEASLQLAKGGRKVCLIEKLPLIGGNIIKNEESYPHMECSTCMLAPIQQEILQHEKIDVMTLCTLQKLEGEAGHFQAVLRQKPRFVSLTACIGCGMCFDPCPVTLDNAWEENLGKRKAIFVPCAGALPNVPVIDAENCLRLNGKKKECQACQEACMFEAIDYSEKEESVEIQTGAIILATGFEMLDVSGFSHLGYGRFPGVYTAMEFERLFASNGPTSGEITLRGNGKAPESAAIIHCVGRKNLGYCSGVCCMSSLKHAHFIKHKLPDARVYHVHSDLCVPGTTSQAFLKKVEEEGAQFIFQPFPDEVQVLEQNGKLIIRMQGNEKPSDLTVDMLILAPAMVPGSRSAEMADILGIERDQYGFFKTSDDRISAAETSKPGIFVIGCAEGPKDGQNAVIQAEAAVGRVLQSVPAAQN